jgi:hypothetical protein
MKLPAFIKDGEFIHQLNGYQVSKDDPTLRVRFSLKREYCPLISEE